MERKFAEVGREGGLEERGARQEDSCPRETVILEEAGRGGAAVRTGARAAVRTRDKGSVSGRKAEGT